VSHSLSRNFGKSRWSTTMVMTHHHGCRSPPSLAKGHSHTNANASNEKRRRPHAYARYGGANRQSIMTSRVAHLMLCAKTKHEMCCPRLHTYAAGSHGIKPWAANIGCYHLHTYANGGHGVTPWKAITDDLAALKALVWWQLQYPII